MSDEYVDVESRSLFQNLGDSIKGVLVGIVLFFVSFPILWWNEGRVDPSSVAKNAVEVASDGSKNDGEGKLVAINGELKAQGTIGDPEFLAAGNYIKLFRNVEMYAWVETVKTENKKKVGGGTDVIKTYTYDLKWTSSPKSGAEFKYPEKHRNPPMTYESRSFAANTASVGAFNFDATKIQMPSAKNLSLTDAMINAGVKGKVKRANDQYLFAGYGSLDNPGLGDTRISFSAVQPGGNVTLYGERHGKEVKAYDWKGEVTLFRVIEGTHKEALKTMHGEHVMMTWILRLVGFFCMWIGLSSLLGPIHAILDIIPFVGSAGRFVVGLVLFPVALVLSLITIIVSNIFHSPILMLLTIGAVVGLGMYMVKKKKAAGGAPPAAGGGGAAPPAQPAA